MSGDVRGKNYKVKMRKGEFSLFLWWWKLLINGEKNYLKSNKERKNLKFCKIEIA